MYNKRQKEKDKFHDVWMFKVNIKNKTAYSSSTTGYAMQQQQDKIPASYLKRGEKSHLINKSLI